MNGYNLFDLFLFALLAYSTVVAFVRGFLRELFFFGGLILGLVVAAWNYEHVAQLLARFITTASSAHIVAFFLIVLGVMLASGLIGRALSRTVHAVGLGFFDRLLGAVFGFARGCLLGVTILIAAAAFFPETAWISNSRLSPYFLAGAHAVSFVVPHDLQQQILNGAQQLKHNAPDWIKP
jgi:membrane protein required for colicin V production